MVYQNADESNCCRRESGETNKTYPYHLDPLTPHWCKAVYGKAVVDLGIILSYFALKNQCGYTSDSPQCIYVPTIYGLRKKGNITFFFL